MFTLNQIKEAHAQVKSGADFPKYIQDLSALGILKYITYVQDGHSELMGANSYTLTSDARYVPLKIADESAPEAFKEYLTKHQQGQSDYPTFCKQAAETGTDKWITDIAQMTCTYYDKAGNEIVVETIPGV
ncbi:DUF1398 domain-containing protein [Emticicia agri]|uniref:DUF1398 domain-containing protein n=1 Tax=Emticicia agri TaxID=2492393 RepID=A0A4Q5LQM9_9BACT|nr:DUF1398 family protein [Emticicia agri]RYU91791.1 DUF1398 domain-containing protein [Emticicia agri]